MELGADGVLMNTAIAEAQDPMAMATAMKLAVQSGRLAYRAAEWHADVRERQQPAGWRREIDQGFF
jgi:thiazole synthase ThiGH ThiG subunit